MLPHNKLLVELRSVCALQLITLILISDDVGNGQCQCSMSKLPHHADRSWYHDLSQLGHFIGAAALGVVSIAGSSFRSEAERSRLLQGSRVPPPPGCLFLKDAVSGNSPAL